MMDIVNKPMHPIFLVLYPNLLQVGDSVIVIPETHRLSPSHLTIAGFLLLSVCGLIQFLNVILKT